MIYKEEENMKKKKNEVRIKELEGQGFNVLFIESLPNETSLFWTISLKSSTLQ